MERNGWLSMKEHSWKWFSLSFKVNKLHHIPSDFQEVKVADVDGLGNVLFINGDQQCTPLDEFAFHEMEAHLAVNSHTNPRKVLVLGGGDGGVARELVKLRDVESVDLCERDPAVVEASKTFLPYLNSAYNNPKLTVYMADAHDFLRAHPQQYDVIIAECTEPSRGEELEPNFNLDFYTLTREALKPGGLVCGPSNNMWMFPATVRRQVALYRELFPVVRYSAISMPTFSAGLEGFILASLDPDTKFEEPLKLYSEAEKREYKLKYYNPEVHRAAFALPEFAKDVNETEAN